MRFHDFNLSRDRRISRSLPSSTATSSFFLELCNTFNIGPRCCPGCCCGGYLSPEHLPANHQGFQLLVHLAEFIGFPGSTKPDPVPPCSSGMGESCSDEEHPVPLLRVLTLFVSSSCFFFSVFCSLFQLLLFSFIHVFRVLPAPVFLMAPA